MYRHLMVPLDDSPLSVETVNQAVLLARVLGAKVTFFTPRRITARRALARSSG